MAGSPHQLMKRPSLMATEAPKAASAGIECFMERSRTPHADATEGAGVRGTSRITVLPAGAIDLSQSSRQQRDMTSQRLESSTAKPAPRRKAASPSRGLDGDRKQVLCSEVFSTLFETVWFGLVWCISPGLWVPYSRLSPD